MIRKAFALLIMVTLFLAPSVAGVDVEDVANELFCTCGCSLVLAACEETMRCDVAKTMKGQIQAMINEGNNKEQILEEMQKTYGPTVLTTPPKEGFKLTLWTYPIIGLGIGSVIIYVLSKRRKDVKWYFDPDEVLELSEEEFAEMGDLEIEEYKDRSEEISLKYQRLFEEEYKKFRAKTKEKKGTSI